MRQYKTVARILLILSVVNHTSASFAPSRAMHGARTELLNLAEDVAHMKGDEGVVGLKANAPPKPASSLASSDPKPNSEEVVDPKANAPPEPASSDSKPKSKDGVFFTGELHEKIQEYYVLSTLLAVSTGVARVAQFQISGKADPGRYVCPFFSSVANASTPWTAKILICLSSTVGRKDLITRAFDVSRILNDHRQDQEDLVSRSLTNLRDEDLRFLDTLSRGLLNSLD